MNYNEACGRIEKMVATAEFKALSIGYNGMKRGPGRYTTTAKNPQGVRVSLAYSGSYKDMVNEVRDYFKA